MEALATKYRPATFDDLVGQRAVHVPLRRMVEAGKVPGALLFAGCRGTGKTTTARILAAALNCDTPPVPCAACPACKAIATGSSLDLVEIDAASNGHVDDIRALRQQVLYGADGRYRLVVLDEAQSISAAGFNALLKITEEPPPGTIFVLCTTEPAKIPDTVASRFMPFRFARISVVDIAGRLRHIADAEGITIDDALLHRFAERADGALRDAVMALDQAARAGITTIEAHTELTGEYDCGPTLLRHLIDGDLPAAFGSLTTILTRTAEAATVGTALAQTLRDLLVLRAGGDLAVTGAAHAQRAELAQRVTARDLVTALGVLWDLKTKVRAVDDARTALELAGVMIADKLAPAAAAPAATPAATAGKLTLAQMRSLR